MMTPRPTLLLLSLLSLLAAARAVDPCDLKPDPGPCKGSFPRFFYNPSTQKCETFTWGGCDGVVPFVTLRDCRIAQCAVPRCLQRPFTGPCRASIPRFFFNQHTQKCQQFIWGGCKGNVPFETLPACEKLCEKVNPCKQKPATGPCKARLFRYFFNAHTNKCERFVWGGCNGSVPFDTLQECVSAHC